MQQKKSCGVIVMRSQPQMSFLLLQKPHCYDLPKGQIEAGEDEISCALRELFEESGITVNDIDLDHQFRCTIAYPIRRRKRKKTKKIVVIFLAWLKHEVSVKISEHIGYTWLEWNPPHIIQQKLIDPILKELENYLFL